MDRNSISSPGEDEEALDGQVKAREPRLPRVGLRRRHPRTLAEITRAVGRSRERIGQIEAAATRRLRKKLRLPGLGRPERNRVEASPRDRV